MRTLLTVLCLAGLAAAQPSETDIRLTKLEQQQSQTMELLTKIMAKLGEPNGPPSITVTPSAPAPAPVAAVSPDELADRIVARMDDSIKKYLEAKNAGARAQLAERAAPEAAPVVTAGHPVGAYQSIAGTWHRLSSDGIWYPAQAAPPLVIANPTQPGVSPGVYTGHTLAPTPNVVTHQGRPTYSAAPTGTVRITTRARGVVRLGGTAAGGCASGGCGTTSPYGN